jgi:nitroreductase
MLTVTEAIEKRRSIRKFKPDPVPDELINQILEAGRLAPSGTIRHQPATMALPDH